MTRAPGRYIFKLHRVGDGWHWNLLWQQKHRVDSVCIAAGCQTYPTKRAAKKAIIRLMENANFAFINESPERFQ